MPTQLPHYSNSSSRRAFFRDFFFRRTVSSLFLTVPAAPFYTNTYHLRLILRLRQILSRIPSTCRRSQSSGRLHLLIIQFGARVVYVSRNVNQVSLYKRTLRRNSR